MRISTLTCFAQYVEAKMGMLVVTDEHIEKVRARRHASIR